MPIDHQCEVLHTIEADGSTWAMRQSTVVLNSQFTENMAPLFFFSDANGVVHEYGYLDHAYTPDGTLHSYYGHIGPFDWGHSC